MVHQEKQRILWDLYRQQLQGGFHRQQLPNASLLFMISCLPATTSDRNVALYKSQALKEEEGVRCQHCGIALAEDIPFFIVYSFLRTDSIINTYIEGKQQNLQRTRNVGSFGGFEYKWRVIKGRIAANRTEPGNSVLICLPLLIDFIGVGLSVGQLCWDVRAKLIVSN